MKKVKTKNGYLHVWDDGEPLNPGESKIWKVDYFENLPGYKVPQYTKYINMYQEYGKEAVEVKT